MSSLCRIMIVIAARPPLTLQHVLKMHATARRVNARPRRQRITRITASFDPGLLVHGVQLTAQMFTAAVCVYSSLNYFMYRRIRKEHEKKDGSGKKEE